jgi:hypothetical protein
MDNQEKFLKEIWEKDYMDTLPHWVKERGYCYSENTAAKDILITGINPSYKKGQDGSWVFDFQASVHDDKLDSRYWHRMRRMLVAPGIDLRSRAAYLDIFYFRHTKAIDIKRKVNPSAGWLDFAIDQLKLTQHTIEEVIRPKVIVIANKESSAYWGKDEKYVGMGYTFAKVEHPYHKDMYEITGFRPSPGRVAPELTDTHLKGTRVVFSKYSWTGAVYPSTVFLHTLLL